MLHCPRTLARTIVYSGFFLATGLNAALAADPGAAVERRTLLEDVWGTRWYGPSKTIDVHVSALRRKLGDPGWIETVRGVGFRLRSP